MRHWAVASSIFVADSKYLLVANRRRNGSLDWSPPGGAIDEGEKPLEALRREVVEETGLVVESWSPLAYEVEVRFVDLEMRLDVVVHCAAEWAGDLRIDDPDGIVERAEWFDENACREALEGAPRWVSEPFSEFVADGSTTDRLIYEVRGHRLSEAEVQRLGAC